MRAAREFAEARGYTGGELVADIEARDAEHRAELAAAQCTIEQLGKDDAAIAEKLDRAVGYLRKMPPLLGHGALCICGLCAYLRELAAPPPAESTPVLPAPPDGIWERLERLEKRVDKLEAKGEPGTHCCVAERCTEGRLP